MEIEEITEYLSNPDKVLDIGLMERLIDETTFFIHTLELELADEDFALDEMLKPLIEKLGQVNKAEAALRITDEYRARKKKEILLKSLKSYRANIRKKRDRLLRNY